VTDVSEDGRLPKSRRDQIAGHLQLFAGGPVRIQIGRPKRSSRANRFYWRCVIGVVHEAMIDAGIGFMETNDGIQMVTAEALHTLFKYKYLEPQTAVLFGDDVTLPPTTTTLDSTSFHYFIEQIKNDPQVRQLGVHFPEPDGEFRSYSIAETQ